jgi:N-acetylglucosaminyldiphosphoundecaprenol N-acetyl-beta-D-mannosaminyltransferase
MAIEGVMPMEHEDGGGDAREPAIPTVRIGGIRIARLTRDGLSRIMHHDVADARAGTRRLPRIVTSANGSVIADYHADPAQRALIDAADIVDADGMPLVFASRIFCREPLAERTATTDFLLDAAEMAAKVGIRFYFIGARPGVAARAAEHLRSRYPDLKVAGVRHGYFKPDQVPAICEQIVASGADVLWVGMGSPLQERFAVENRERLAGLGWIRTCGGLFDHYGGGVSRAPAWMQSMGLEWAYRAAREPLRLGVRYLTSSPIAIYHLLTKTGD